MTSEVITDDASKLPQTPRHRDVARRLPNTASLAVTISAAKLETSKPTLSLSDKTEKNASMSNKPSGLSGLVTNKKSFMNNRGIEEDVMTVRNNILNRRIGLKQQPTVGANQQASANSANNTSALSPSSSSTTVVVSAGHNATVALGRTQNTSLLPNSRQPMSVHQSAPVPKSNSYSQRSTVHVNNASFSGVGSLNVTSKTASQQSRSSHYNNLTLKDRTTVADDERSNSALSMNSTSSKINGSVKGTYVENSDLLNVICRLTCLCFSNYY